MELLVFNPEHDYALADNQPQYVTLRSAAQFAYDCAPFMHCLSVDENVVLDAYVPFGKDFQKNFAPLEGVERITKVTPWGWDAAVVYQLQRNGIPEALLPSASQLAKIRELAHRKTTIPAMEFLRANLPSSDNLPQPPECLTSIQEIESFVKRYEHVLFKSPYSGNGRGHLYAHHTCTPTLLRQCTGVLKRQGSILAERQYNVVQDFAMEFTCDRGEVSFRGYSLFHTEHYGYGGNLLMPDEEILRTLSQYINIVELQQIQSWVAQFLAGHIAAHYDGDAGVDMFVYQEDECYRIHPFVEVNLRKTMGLAAHDIYARYCHPESRGIFRILRAPVETMCTSSLQFKTSTSSLQSEMQFRDGLWSSGTLFLNPIAPETQYAVEVTLQNDNFPIFAV
jgi:hypothetical protein